MKHERRGSSVPGEARESIGWLTNVPASGRSRNVATYENQSSNFLLGTRVLAWKRQTMNRIFGTASLMGSTCKDGMRIRRGEIDRKNAEIAGFEGNVGQPKQHWCIVSGAYKKRAWWPQWPVRACSTSVSINRGSNRERKETPVKTRSCRLPLGKRF